MERDEKSLVQKLFDSLPNIFGKIKPNIYYLVFIKNVYYFRPIIFPVIYWGQYIVEVLARCGRKWGHIFEIRPKSSCVRSVFSCRWRAESFMRSLNHRAAITARTADHFIGMTLLIRFLVMQPQKSMGNQERIKTEKVLRVNLK